MPDLSVRQFLLSKGADPREGIRQLATFYNTFSLRSLMNMKVAIVLGGGGAKGDFQIGALQYMYEIGIRPQIICGTSVGAINSLVLAQGDDGLNILTDIWLNKMKTEDDMYIQEPWFKKLSPELQAFFELSFAKLAVRSVKFLVVDLPLYLLFPFLLIFDGKEISDFKDAIDSAKDAKCLYRLSPTEGLLRDPKTFNISKANSSGIKLRLALVSLESGELRYVDESGILTRTGDVDLVDLVSAAIASASIPAVFPPVKLGPENYVDGGVRSNLPIKMAVDAGANFIYAISCSKLTLDITGSFDNKKIIDISKRALVDILLNQAQEGEINPPRGWGVNINIISPDFEVHDTFTIDPALIRIQIAYGYFKADDTIGTHQGNREKIEELTNMIIKLRMDIWDLEPSAAEIKQYPESHTQSVPDPEGLRNVRSMKRQLKELVEQRQQLGGSTPSDVDTWWKQWERRYNPDWDPIIETPWDYMCSRLGIVEAETPP